MNLRELLNHYRISYKQPGEHPHCTWNRINIDCPFCSLGMERYRLGIHEERLSAHCWSCGFVNLLRCLSEITRGPAHVLRGLLEGIDKPQQQERIRGKLVIPTGLSELLPQHRRYLEGRGLDPDELQEVWGIKGLGCTPRLCWRIWIPVLVNEQVVSWTTRSVVDGVQVRYINAKPTEELQPLKQTLLGIDMVRHSVIVCEGPMDAMRIGPGAVCTFGIAYSRAQANLLSRFPQIVVCFDNEPTAQKKALKLCHLLNDFGGNVRNVCLDAKDPGEASKEEINEIRKRFLDG